MSADDDIDVMLEKTMDDVENLKQRSFAIRPDHATARTVVALQQSILALCNHSRRMTKALLDARRNQKHRDPDLAGDRHDLPGEP